MPTSTTTYSFQKPTVGGDSDVWGGHVNDMMDKVDDLLDGTLPITPAAGNDIDIVGTNAATNSVTTLLTLNSQSSGTPAAGIGSALAFAAETAAGNTETGVVLQAVTTDVTAASEDFDFVVRTMAGGAAAAERMRVSASGLQLHGTNAYTLRSIQYLTSGTAATYTTPSNCRALRVTCVGGGGGGGDAVGIASGVAVAAAGGGGATCVLLITSPQSTYTYTIGAGGTGASTSGADGSAGGTTTFSGGAVSMSAGGGAGGGGNSGSTSALRGGVPGDGGTATGGDLNIAGEAGTTPTRIGTTQGSGSNAGGSTYFPSNLAGPVLSGSTGATQAGANATQVSVGGSGGVAVNTASSANGGNGGAGIIIVEEYF